MKNPWSFFFFFFYFAAISTLFPYLVLYYGELSLTGSQIGVLTAISPLVVLVSAPLLTGIADSTHRHRLMLALTLVCVIFIVLALSAVSTFAMLLMLIILFAFFMAPVNPLADSATMFMLGDRKDMYGRVRLGGTIGFGIASLIAGMVIQRAGLNSSFFMFALLIFITMLFGLKLRFPEIEKKVSVTKGIKSLLARPRWVWFFAMVFIGGLSLAIVNTYLFLYMDELGASKTLMGFSMLVATISEVPLLFFSNRLIRRFGPLGLLVLALFVSGLRLLLYSVVHYPTGIVVIQCLQGLTFPLVWVAGVAYSNDHAPVGLNATAQGLFGSMLMGFGAAAGNFLGGLLIDAYDIRTMFLTMGLITLVSLITLVLVEKRLPAETNVQTI